MTLRPTEAQPMTWWSFAARMLGLAAMVGGFYAILEFPDASVQVFVDALSMSARALGIAR